jgi:hypothetical protein
MGDAQKALEKVRLLLEKVKTPGSEEEARTCAHIACKLIVKHEMSVSLNGDRRWSGIGFTGEDADDARDNFVRSVWDHFERERAASNFRETARQAREAREAKSRKVSPGVYAETVYGSTVSGYKNREKNPDEPIPAPCTTNCRWCGKLITVREDLCVRLTQGGFVHPECLEAHRASEKSK